LKSVRSAVENVNEPTLHRLAHARRHEKGSVKRQNGKGDGDAGMIRFLRLLAAAFLPYLVALGIAQRATGRYALAIAMAGE